MSRISAISIRLLIGCLIVAVASPAANAQSSFEGDVFLRSPDEAFPVSLDQPHNFAQTSTPTFDRTPVSTPNLYAAESDSPDGEHTATPVPATTPLNDLLSPEELTPTLRTVLMVGMLSLVPVLLVMTTCFARFAIVFGLLRQGLGAQQWLPNQIVLALSLFLTLLVMAPVWTRSYEQGIRPYAEATYDTPTERRQALETALVSAVQPVRNFMATQIAVTGNESAVDMLLAYQSGDREVSVPQYYEDVPLSVLLPAYLLSELKTAFVIGFQIVLPFLIIDLVVASVLTGMGLMMLPPVLVSLPFKLLLFVLIDGWALSVQMLLSSVPPG